MAELLPILGQLVSTGGTFGVVIAGVLAYDWFKKRQRGDEAAPAHSSRLHDEIKSLHTVIAELSNDLKRIHTDNREQAIMLARLEERISRKA